MKNTIFDNIKLELPKNHLFNKLAKCVEQNNRPKYLGNIINIIIGLGIMVKTDSLKCLGQYYNDKQVLVKERMSIAQILLVRMSLKYC